LPHYAGAAPYFYSHAGIGELEEIVQGGVTGLLFESGDSEGLASKMRQLWEDPELCCCLGAAGREKAMREYSEDVYFKRLMEVNAY